MTFGDVIVICHKSELLFPIIPKSHVDKVLSHLEQEKKKN